MKITGSSVSQNDIYEGITKVDNVLYTAGRSGRNLLISKYKEKHKTMEISLALDQFTLQICIKISPSIS